jgi:4-diphosphocytidyl-2-C-methyl-D-erythritol kinase
MHIHRSALGLLIQAPAKLNLFFEVLAKRSDGYHEIETLMCPIELYDTLHFQEDPNGQLELRCRRVFGAGGSSGRGLDEVPEGPENLVLRAMELVRRRAGVRRGAKLLLVKRIPAAAGLGGGSSDAAAALVAANEGWRLGRSRAELAQWAAELGSDVPFFLVGGAAVCRGRGERVTSVDGLGRLSFVVVRPPQGLSTAAVYSVCRPAAEPQSVGPLVEALRRGDWRQAGRRMLNRLQPAAEGLSHWVRRLREESERVDFLGHGMSGSGTSYFGLCRHARQARRCARRLEGLGVGAVFAVQSCR